MKNNHYHAPHTPHSYGSDTTGSPDDSNTDNAVKVIKGEIHNVLNVMRSDARYVSSMRFVIEELPIDEHPLLQSFRELHEVLSTWELRTAPPLHHGSAEAATAEGVEFKRPDLVLYITPFCAAVSGREISASVTGAALSALHKFLLYGFITPETPSAADGMTLVAKCLLHCTFEESDHGKRRGISSASSSKTASSSSRRSCVAQNVQDEQVVLKLLNLSALVVRYSLLGISKGQQPLLDASIVEGLLDTCLHVSHRAQNASALLKSAAGDALSQIVLVVFGEYTNSQNDSTSTTNNCTSPSSSSSSSVVLSNARVGILTKLASLIDPNIHSDDTCVTSLTLINIALETMRHSPSQNEITILQNTICKHLLQLSTTNDLVILSLTLRVIFNLFQTIRNHLKVPLEVFLTSVHLRILDSTGSSALSNEQKEVVLESLLEFCQEPALMQDLYLNYDCDVHCSNLFETICTTLANTSEHITVDGDNHDHHHQPAPPSPRITADDSVTIEDSITEDEESPPPPLNALNRLAIEGIFAVIDSIARRCQEEGGFRPPTPALSREDSLNVESPSGCEALSDTASDTSSGNLSSLLTGGSLGTHLSSHEAHQIVLQQRKRKKTWQTKVSKEFNRKPMGKEWVQIAERCNLLPPNCTADDVAQFLFGTPQLDKTQMGEYLSKGPAEKYPFHANVRKSFASLFDFSDLSFSQALRKFLSRFRLPGEAQQIDRLMEAFSVRLYEQHQSNKYHEKQHEDSIPQIDGVVTSYNITPFRSSDAAFVLAFSTIMLNTDLHNPMIKDERRMTVDQFIRNNRGINDGQDLPERYLRDLYYEIRENEIEVEKELSDVVKRNSQGDLTSLHNWDGLLSKSEQVTKPFFTPANSARNIFQAGVHERDMFQAISSSAIQCISSVFLRSSDDVLIFKAIRGFKQMAKICVYFGMDAIFNDVVTTVLEYGRDYIEMCIVSQCTGNYDNFPMIPKVAAADGSWDEDDDEHVKQANNVKEACIPPFLAASQRMKLDYASDHHPTRSELTGCAGHRGLLALDCGLRLIRGQKNRLREAWPSFIQCLCALRDAGSLPVGLSDLDDFADSHGNVFPPSPFARQSQRRLNDYYRSFSDQDISASQDGWFKIPSLFSASPAKDVPSEEDDENLHHRHSLYTVWLLRIAEDCELEQVVLMRCNDVSHAKQTIRALLDAYPNVDDEPFEQHAVFSLELAARAFFSNRDRATDLLPMFQSKFDSILQISEISANNADNNVNLRTPFLMERIIVTILRAVIHLYDIAELRPYLSKSWRLLNGLPATFTRYVANRISCGMAIILRGSFYLFETTEEWKFLGEILENLCKFGSGRGFIFDGIASTIEFSLPTDMVDAKEHDREILSDDGCLVFFGILCNFVVGKYENDMSWSVPAMLCLEKVYMKASSSTNVPDYHLAGNITAAYYVVCRSGDAEGSEQALGCFKRFLSTMDVKSIPNDKWIGFLDMMIQQQPQVKFDVARSNCIAVLCQTLLTIVAQLSHEKDVWEDLTDVINRTANLVGENLRLGRRGRVGVLFERTVDAVTITCNGMVSPDYGGDIEYCRWAGETLVSELEKVGASGGTFRNMAAITKPST